MKEGLINRDFIPIDIHKPYVIEQSSAFPEDGYNKTLIAWVEE